MIRLAELERPEAPASISEVCRLAGVNRANLYARHESLVAEIRRARTAKKPQQQVVCRPDRPWRESHLELEQRNRGLLYLCLELQLEVSRLKAKLNSMVKRRG